MSIRFDAVATAAFCQGLSSGVSRNSPHSTCIGVMVIDVNSCCTHVNLSFLSVGCVVLYEYSAAPICGQKSGVITGHVPC